MRIIDITHPLTDRIASWPGDTPVRFGFAWKMSEGASVNVGALTTSVHSGTHTDAPFHFLKDGKTVDQLDLSAYIGPAVVVDVRGVETIGEEQFRGVDLSQSPRVLLKTNAWPDVSTFPAKIPVMSPGTPTFLRSHGVVLVGLDVPSVDALDSKDLPIHHELGRCGISILENLNLTEVPPGKYELIALPMLIGGADGAPVRAILRTLD
jgi:arylformamidase